MSTKVAAGNSIRDRVDARLRRVLEAHFDPDGGSAYWLDRQRKLGFDVLDEIGGVCDLPRLGIMDPSDLVSRPLLDFVPRSRHGFRSEWIIGQTGGTTGCPAWTAYSPAEFAEAFITPFELAAHHVGFPCGENWLYVGPSGPHIIGKAAACLARTVQSPEPFSVDFDSRWAKKLADGSFAARRYMDHVVEQALEVIADQRIGVLFTTPKVLDRLAERMTRQQRDRIGGVHYGGMAVSPDGMRRFQEDRFPNAVHLSGYGNTLFGCCLELNASVRRALDYFPLGDRLLFAVIPPDEESAMPAYQFPPHEVFGRLVFARLDETMLLVNMLERDQAGMVCPPHDAPDGFVLAGVRDPQPLPSEEPGMAIGLY